MASGLNLFSMLKFLRLRLPKRFGLWMLRDCAWFLFRLRNAGATPPVNVPRSLELTMPGRGNFDLYEDGLAPQGRILSPISQI